MDAGGARAQHGPNVAPPVHLLISMTTNGVMDLIANLGHTGDVHALTAPLKREFSRYLLVFLYNSRFSSLMRNIYLFTSLLINLVIHRHVTMIFIWDSGAARENKDHPICHTGLTDFSRLHHKVLCFMIRML